MTNDFSSMMLCLGMILVFLNLKGAVDPYFGFGEDPYLPYQLKAGY